ncbi:MAG: chemotaxis protein CheR [Alphaproteobacteria bacterium]|nr:MAG: chemotaxis protein CheR [Alphaproteobacteria bacterium]
MPAEDFELYRSFLYKESGLVITPEKMYLLESRLNPVVKKMEMEGLADLTAKVRMNDVTAKHAIIEAMTTNETFFFRDTHPFERFEEVVLPKIMESKPAGSTIRIWNAACSSGQEPYSLGLILRENAHKFGGYKFEITATDLSEDILDTAKRAVYTQFEVQRGMPIKMLMKYFTQQGSSWALNEDIKSMVKFEKFNLLDPMTKFPEFDVVFCRNVLIYFDQETKGKILGELRKHVSKHGFLFLGGAETVIGITDVFKAMKGERGLYIPSHSVHA